MPIPHPTGSEVFARVLNTLGAPTPWRISDEEVGSVLADDGSIVLQVDLDRERSDDAASALALSIVMAVNTLAGLKAEAA